MKSSIDLVFSVRSLLLSAFGPVCFAVTYLWLSSLSIWTLPCLRRRGSLFTCLTAHTCLSSLMWQKWFGARLRSLGTRTLMKSQHDSLNWIL